MFDDTKNLAAFEKFSTANQSAEIKRIPVITDKEQKPELNHYSPDDDVFCKLLNTG